MVKWGQLIPRAIKTLSENVRNRLLQREIDCETTRQKQHKFKKSAITTPKIKKHKIAKLKGQIPKGHEKFDDIQEEDSLVDSQSKSMHPTKRKNLSEHQKN